MGTLAEHPSLGVMRCFPPSLASALQRSLGRKGQGLMTEHEHLLITPVVENLQFLYFREKGYIPIQNEPHSHLPSGHKRHSLLRKHHSWLVYLQSDPTP